MDDGLHVKGCNIELEMLLFQSLVVLFPHF